MSEARPLAHRRLAEVVMRSIEYLERPFWQRASFELLCGKKGVGKGTFTAGLASRVTRGKLFPEPRNVLIVAAEDSDEIDIKPRVVAAGGDPERVFTVQEPLVYPGDIRRLKQTALEIGDVGLIVDDPVASHVRGDTQADGPVRLAIEPLNGLAHELDCLFLGIRHLSEKDTSRGALAAVLGSSAWVQVPRAVLVIAADDEEERLFHIAVAAGNRSARGAGRMFRIELVELEGLNEPVTCAVEGGVSGKSVDELLGRVAEEKRVAVKRVGAKEVILRELALEPRSMDYLKARCAAEIGCHGNTVWQAANELKADGEVAVTNSGPGTAWLWYLTSQRSHDFTPKSEADGEVNGNGRLTSHLAREDSLSQEVNDYTVKTSPKSLTSQLHNPQEAKAEVSADDEEFLF